MPPPRTRTVLSRLTGLATIALISLVATTGLAQQASQAQLSEQSPRQNFKTKPLQQLVTELNAILREDPNAKVIQSIIVYDWGSDPSKNFEPNFFPHPKKRTSGNSLDPTLGANYEICGKVNSILDRQEAGAFWYRWCAHTTADYVRMDGYYYANGRLLWYNALSEDLSCSVNYASIPTAAQVVCTQ